MNFQDVSLRLKFVDSLRNYLGIVENRRKGKNKFISPRLDITVLILLPTDLRNTLQRISVSKKVKF